jgi:hypothetical protein
MHRLFCLLLFAIALSCSDESDCAEECENSSFCGVDNPAENLPWLKEQINELEQWNHGDYFYFASVRYMGMPAILQSNCCINCDSRPRLLNCDGEEIETDGFVMEQLTHFKLLYGGTECTF